MSDSAPPPITRREALTLSAALGAGLAFGPIQEALAAGANLPLLAPAADAPPATDALIPLIALNRLCFGPRPGDASTSFGAFAALAGADNTDRLYAFVDQQLDPNTIPDTDCTNRLTAAGLATLNKSALQMWTDHVINATGTNASNIRNQPVREARTAWMIRALYSRRQLYEVLVHFWHNHFSIYAWDSAIAPVFMLYDRDVIRAHALGNFRDFIEAVAKSTAMLYYLDNATSQGAQFNENFARELCELHTLGSENYLGVGDPTTVPTEPFAFPGTVPAYWTTSPNSPPTEIAVGYVDNDVYEVARCLTGWRVNNGQLGAPANNGTFLYYTSWHDRANKLIFGKYFPADAGSMEDGWKAMDMLAYHPGTARFIARKLCRRFISDDPPQSLVDSTAQVFMDNRRAADQLKQVVRHVLRSPEFRQAWGAKIRTPEESALSLLRASLADYRPVGSQEANGTLHGLWTRYDAIGQQVFGRRSPDGYPDVKDAWTGAVSILYRWQFCNYTIEGGIVNPTTTPAQPAFAPDLRAQMTPPASYTTPNQIVDFWVTRLLGPGYPLAAAVRTELLKMIAGNYPNLTVDPDAALASGTIDNNLRRMVALILMSPDFQWR